MTSCSGRARRERSHPLKPPRGSERAAAAAAALSLGGQRSALSCGRGRSLAPWPPDEDRRVRRPRRRRLGHCRDDPRRSSPHRHRPAHAGPAARRQGGRRVAPRLPGLDVGAARPQLPLLRLRPGDAYRPDRRQRGGRAPPGQGLRDALPHAVPRPGRRLRVDVRPAPGPER